MDANPNPPKLQSCIKHNLPIAMFNSDPKIGACCLICVQNLTGMTLAEQTQIQWQQSYEKAKQSIDENHQLLNQFLDYLLIYKENINSSLDKIKQLIQDYIANAKQSQSELDLIFKSDSNQSTLIDDIEQLCINQKQFTKNVKDQLGQQLQCFQSKFSDIGKQFEIMGQNEKKVIQGTMRTKDQMTTPQEGKIESQIKSKKIQYELIKESTLKQVNCCRAFAFNKDNSILAVACEEMIIVYEFIKGKISKEMQRLQIHQSQVDCLYFMKNTNSIISSSGDNYIIIWELDSHNKYFVQECLGLCLKKPYRNIYCITMNKNEDQIILGSPDNTLNIRRKMSGFWTVLSGRWNCSQTIKTKDQVMNMSLNEVEDKLIICQNNSVSNSSSIDILVQQNDQKWSIVQTFDFSGYVNRLCFTIDDQFVMQNKTLNCLQIYDYDTNKNQFKAVSQVQIQQIQYCDEFFPCQFTKTLSILTVKHGEYLNIFKVNENYNYELIQAIQYGHHCLYGRITDDGQYLATWDKSSKEIQIRGIQY